MRFPKLLTKAVIKGSKLYFRYGDLCQNDEDLTEYMLWKTHIGVGPICRPNDLIKLHKTGAYRDEIRRLLVQNGKLELLGDRPRRGRPKRLTPAGKSI